MGIRRVLAAAMAGALTIPMSVAGPSGAAATAATTFSPLPMTGSPLFETDADTDFWVNAVAPADVDADGDLDLAVIGFFVVYHESVEEILAVMRNDGPDGAGGWAFTEERLPFDDMFAGASDLAWGDFDGDGDPDLAVGTEGDTVVYGNDAGALAPIPTTTPLPGYDEDSAYTGTYDFRSLTWADVDNDDDLDLLVPSVFDRETFEFSTRLLRNDGPAADASGAWTFTDTGADLDPTAHAQSAWADDDGDEDLDLFLTNVDSHRDAGFVRRYENDGGTFTGEDLLAISVEHGMADWGDYDADGDLDILVAGNIREADGETYDTVLRTYRNDGGSYTEIAAPAADWLDIHAATWADYDSDGDVDLLATGNKVGEEDIEGKSEVFVNEAGVFTSLGTELPAPINSIGRGGAFTWFDVDNDGDLDYLVAGAYYVPDDDGLVEAQVNLYRNDAPAANAAPSAPTGLTASSTRSGGDTVQLAWSAATDDSTAAPALTYDLDVRRRGTSTVTTRRLPAPGNVSATTGWELKGLAPGTYDWSVRAVDSAFNGGRRATGSFTVAPRLAVTAAPVGGPVTVPAEGGTFRYDVQVTNVTASPVTFDLWTATRTPGGRTRVTSAVTKTLAPGATLTRRFSEAVPASAPAGRYRQIVAVDDRPTAEAVDMFVWVKAPS